MAKNKARQIATIANDIQLDMSKVHHHSLAALRAAMNIENTQDNCPYISDLIQQLNTISMLTIPYTP